MVVYMLWCEATEKLYIGQSTGSLNDRVKHHRRNAASGKVGRLYDEIRELGWEAFEVFVLERCDSVAMLNDYERLWITYTNATDTQLGYNTRSGGDNRMLSEAVKQKCREAGKKGAAHGIKGKHRGVDGGKFGYLGAALNAH